MYNVSHPSPCLSLSECLFSFITILCVLFPSSLCVLSSFLHHYLRSLSLIFTLYAPYAHRRIPTTADRSNTSAAKRCCKICPETQTSRRMKRGCRDRCVSPSTPSTPDPVPVIILILIIIFGPSTPIPISVSVL